MPGTPLTVNVDANDGHFVSAYGPGLIQGGCGEHLEFFVTGKTSKTAFVLITSTLDITCGIMGHINICAYNWTYF
jgi:hypothetical protein